VTVLFCDLTGSTALGESTDPETLRALLARYFERMKGIVESHGGTVEKFIGDAVMAVFGVPVAHEDDALRAVRAAAEMRDALPELGVQARIGVNTGEVVTGTEERLATGDAVNVAARLEQSAQPGEVLLGGETMRLVQDAVEAYPVDRLELKGKRDRVAAFRLVRVGDAPEREHRSRFVGRERELGSIVEAWLRAVAEERCELVTVVGEAGVGKSRLFTEALAGIDARVVRGRCLPYGEGITYWPVVEVVKQLDALPSDPAAASSVRSLLRQSDLGTSAEEIAWAFRKLLEEQAPLVVAFDDVQWGEEAFLDLVEGAALLASGPLLIVCMGRPELLERRSEWPVSVRLEPLPTEAVDQLIGEQVPDGLRARIAAAAGGNPLFVTEMLAMATGTEEVEVPPSLQALLAARLDQLDPAERRVLERGAVEGEVFHRGAVQALAPEELQVTPRLAALTRKQLIRRDRAVFPDDDGFRFRHLLIRDAAYDGLPKAVRAGLHERFADWLEQHGSSLVELDEILGYHLEHAHRYHVELGKRDEPTRVLALRSAARLGSAGRRALERSDTAGAINLLERAVKLLPLDDPERLALLPSLGFALTQAGELGPAEEVLSSAIELAGESGDRRAELEAVVERVALRLISQPESLEALLREIDKAIPVLDSLGDDRALGRAWYLIGLARYIWGCRFAEGEQALERALNHARRAGDRRQQGEIRTHLWYAAWVGPTPVPDAISRCNEILGELESDRLVEAGALRALASLRARQGDFVEARQLLVRAREAYDELGMRLVSAAIGAFGAGDIEALAGDYEAAERELRIGYNALERMGDKGYMSGVAGFLGGVLYVQGRYDEAEHYADLCRHGSISDDVWLDVMQLSIRAKVLARRGEHAKAEVLAREAVTVAEKTDGLDIRAGAALDLADVLQLAGRAEESTGPIETAIALYQRKGNIVMAERARTRLNEAGVPS
jgi:class 3 adenylate cyclase/predicted ATPase